MELNIKIECNSPTIKTEPGSFADNDVVILETVNTRPVMSTNHYNTARSVDVKPKVNQERTDQGCNNLDKNNNTTKATNQPNQERPRNQESTVDINQQNVGANNNSASNVQPRKSKKKKNRPRHQRGRPIGPLKRRSSRHRRPSFPGEYSNPGIPRDGDEFPGMTGRGAEENKILGVHNHSTKIDLTFQVSAVSKLVIHVKTLLKCKDGVDYLKGYMSNLKRKEYLEWVRLVTKYPFLCKYSR